MSAAGKIWRSSWRIGLSALLLFWIFHTIFLNQAKQSLQARQTDWEALSRWEQWKMAWHFGPPDLWNTLTLIPASVLVLSVLLMGLTILLGTLRWRMVLRVQGLNLSLGRALEISFVAHFFNSFLLGSTGGDLMKAYYAARETHQKKTEAVVTVFVDRLIGLWAMLFFAGIMMIPNTELILNHAGLRPLCAVILAMFGACSMLLMIGFWGGITRGWSGARTWLRRLPKGQWLERSLDSCRKFGQARWFVLKSVALSMALNAVCVLQILVLSRGLHQSLPALALFMIVPMIICLAAIPITPSGLGVRENLFVFALAGAPLAVDATSALSLSLLAYAGSLFFSIVGGFVYLVFKEKHHLREKELAEAPSVDS